MIFIAVYTIMTILTASIMTAMIDNKDLGAVVMLIIISLFIWWIILPLLVLTKITLVLAEKIEYRFNK